MKVVVYSRILKDKDIPFVQTLFDVLAHENITAFVHKPYLEMVKERIQLEVKPNVFEGYADFKNKEIDFVITLGGDGTILGAIKEVRDSGVPILGINLGRLGFLASIEKRRIQEALTMLKRGSFSINERSLLYLDTSKEIFGETRFALNDLTLLKRDNSSMITIHTYIDGAYLNTYWADGVIVSTPTGSTGYSLSCGGPIVFPNSGNFVITPVAPHNLNMRPIVIADDSVISFKIEGRTENFLCTLDSRFETITSEYDLAVRKCDFTIKLVQLDHTSFLQTLREKLAWGTDLRN